MGSVSEHFTNEELACHHCGVNECKPELLDALELLRASINRPIIVNDAYRCPEHNRAIGGVPDSQHVLGLAADIRVPGMTAAELYFAAVKIGPIKGLGRDDHKNYLHVDVRQRFAQWCYNQDGRQVGWYPPTTPAPEDEERA